ncbi:hypothetical protein HYPSUDRAFT_58346 [Hypholoma sublateritium FD-334 SS-4]|uniref:Uncharacterized protein n=1 Tax=Hypholoma sublateritium (strain FD-334 SS-4) TaxID=945553 RepID=A0A0D2KNT8_HYPSF|nr:hypothetical protein HYPSUDRAFT_58346 [Hypholoma sublateritium FD-334 SS-4]
MYLAFVDAAVCDSLHFEAKQDNLRAYTRMRAPEDRVRGAVRLSISGALKVPVELVWHRDVPVQIDASAYIERQRRSAVKPPRERATLELQLQDLLCEIWPFVPGPASTDARDPVGVIRRPWKLGALRSMEDRRDIGKTIGFGAGDTDMMLMQHGGWGKSRSLARAGGGDARHRERWSGFGLDGIQTWARERAVSDGQRTSTKVWGRAWVNVKLEINGGVAPQFQVHLLLSAVYGIGLRRRGMFRWRSVPSVEYWIRNEDNEAYDEDGTSVAMLAMTLFVRERYYISRHLADALRELEVSAHSSTERERTRRF